MTSRYTLDTIFNRFPNIIFTMLNPSKDYGPNTVVFKIPLNINKLQVKNYIQELYKVKVNSVNTMIYQGKHKRNRDGIPIKRPDWKKAIVKLSDIKWKYPTFEQQKTMKSNPAQLTTQELETLKKQQKIQSESTTKSDAT